MATDRRRRVTDEERRASKPARERDAGRASADSSLAALIRAEVQARVRKLVPSIIREEVARSFGSKVR
jgi:hypothetical protein